VSTSEASRNGNAAAAKRNGHAALGERPRLVFFYESSSGKARRTEGYLSQVLQRRHNHESFQVYRVDVQEHPELAEQFRVDEVPTLVVVEDKKVTGRLTAPRGCRQIEELLAPWLH
jgi:thioredoxin-like negative regulator of GroEL